MSRIARVFETVALCTVLPTAVLATPPERPVSVAPLSAKLFEDMRSERDGFVVPLVVRTGENLDGVVLSVEIFLQTDTGQRRVDGFSERFEIRERGEVELKIPVFPEPGVYKIEIAAGDSEGSTYDRVMLFQVVTRDGADLMTQQQYRDRRTQSNLERFEETRSLATLSEPAVEISREEAARIEEAGPSLLVRPLKMSPGDAPYVRDQSDDAWRERDPITITGRYVFTDFEGTQRPVVNAGVYVYDDDTFGDDFLGSVATDWNGNYTFSVNNDDGWLQNGRDIYVRIKLENTRWRVKDGGSDYAWTTNTVDDANEGQVINFGVRTLATDREAVQIHNFVNRAWNHATTVGGHDPGFVAVEYPGTGDFFNGEINLSASTNRAPDIAIHEYGHFLMESAYPGGDPSPGGSHGFGDMSQDVRLSWSEGFATGFMLSTCNDGQYNWDEGTSEGAGEWPSCSVQNDTGGREIELFSASNRVGEENEGRVAAALLDFMDVANDDNGGSQNRGRDDDEDANSSNRVSLATIYDDAMFGNGHNDMIEFWTSLAGELSGTRLSLAGDIMRYNWMSRPLQLDCVATKVAAAEARDPERLLAGVRAFRDEGLKPLVDGREIIRIYYEHSPEMAMILLDAPEARRAALTVLRHFALLGEAARSRETLEKIARENDRIIPEEVVESAEVVFELMDQHGSDDLRRALSEMRSVMLRFASLNFEQAFRIADGMARGDASAKSERGLRIERPETEQRIDWERIRDFIPEPIRPE